MTSKYVVGTVAVSVCKKLDDWEALPLSSRKSCELKRGFALWRLFAEERMGWLRMKKREMTRRNRKERLKAMIDGTVVGGLESYSQRKFRGVVNHS